MAFPALAAAIGAYTVNNAMSEMHAGKQAEREMEMMRAQNDMNRANVLSAYSQRVQGMKMAGLNPALAAEGTPAVASVSKGSAASGENVEFDPASLLLEKQMENLDAQTEKTRAEASKIKGVDTENTIADTLFKNASTEERKQAGVRVKQLNEQYADQNAALEGYGKVIAEKWQGTDWYNRLSPDTKYTIDAIASGEVPLTVGGMDALNRSVAAQKDLSDADAAVIRNAFANSILDAQMSDDAVMEALAKEPFVKQGLTKAQTEQVKALTEKVRYKMKELIDAELKGKKLSNQQLDAVIKAFKADDLAFLKSQGEYGKWFESYAEKLLMSMLPGVTGAAVHGSLMRSGLQNQSVQQTSTHTQTDRSHTPPVYGADGQPVISGSTSWSSHDGVQTIKFKPKR